VFIKKVKREVCSNAESKKFRESNPKFIKFSPLFEDEFNFGFKMFSEVDINSAYWFAAKDYGMICEDTFEKGLEVPKKVRLMALGSAASTKDIFSFDGENYTYQGIECNKHGRLAFFTIAKRIDDLMSNAIKIFSGQAAFYWVDALFVKTQFSDSVIHYINGMGFECKVVDLAWIKGDKKKIETMKIKECEGVTDFERKIYFKPKKNKTKSLKIPAKKP
jgi:hypothetical protein